MFRRLIIFAVAIAALVPLLLKYPEGSFELAAGMLLIFSTASTLIFFAFAITALVIGFDHASRRQVAQAEPAHRSLGDQFVA
ncbi:MULTISPECIES: hypothetical protein [unclassified Xanthobacter]|uniref:hypothetical protein n=1 Tax=unclassified Xanthobacter TaxID=2623496 RepID=UPI001EE0C0CB|nr:MULTISPECIES: hypothetical protein [unclassified Xanthobacter]